MKRIAVGCTVAAVVLCGCEKHDASSAGRVDAQSVANWNFFVDKDKITDKERGIASVSSIDGGQATLIVKCDIGAKSNDLYAEVMFRDYMGKSLSGEYDASRELKYRVDGGSIKRAPTYYSDSYALITAPDGFRQFASDISNGKRLVVRATSYDYKTVDSEFSVGGAAEAIRTVAKTCGVQSPV